VSEKISIIDVVNRLLDQAIQKCASDIHIDPTEVDISIRMRIDGLLQDTYRLPKKIHQEIISRIKVLSGLRTDEHAMPQDGKFRYMHAEKFLDVRVSIAPTYFGENAVLRLLNTNKESPSLLSLGFGEREEKILKDTLRRSSGMILATGPTGSGKTTTLYSMLHHIHTPERSIVTIEDPVEYTIPDVRHIQVNARTGLTFATGLRSILRQDPDVIMVGEIRDRDTAQIAIHASLTGHMIFSTLHTNDAATALVRLIDIGVDPYLVASTVTLSIGQRLVRRVCSECKRKTDTGCDACNHTGYRGRLVIAEVMQITKTIQDAVVARSSQADIHMLAMKEGMISMREVALMKVRQGETTLEEIMRVLYDPTT
jgi:type II secretory ATPase GspE/PulE/Tfp pilus assembly ATPase PilB-like protein